MNIRSILAALLLLPAAGFAQDTLSGIGINISQVKGKGVRVEGIIPDGPTDRSGALKKGDVITAVAEGDGTPVSLANKNVEEAVKLIIGESGSTVRLTIETEVDITRGTFKATHIAKPERPRRERPKPLDIGAAAPDIEFEVFADGSKEKLSKYKGKVVVIDFWATWCGPCQKPMAKMQTYAEKHPEFGDKVVFMALSIDRDKSRVAPHLEKKGWNKTFNCWGDNTVGGAYGVTGIPTVYIIDQAGKVAKRGHPVSFDIPAEVKALLDK